MAFRGAASQANSSTSTSVTVTVSGIGGTGPQSGDIVLFYMDGGGGGGTSTLTAPSGFSAVPGISQSLNFNTQNMVWYKVAGASEPSTYTATSNQNDFHAAQVRVYSGRNTSSPFTTVSTFHTSSGSSPLSVDFNGVTAATGDDLVVIGGIDNQSSASTYTFAAPTGYANAQSGSTNTSFAVAAFGADKVNASSGATGTVSGTLTFSVGSTDTGGWLIAIAVASAGGVTVNVPLGTLTLSGQVPTVTTTANQSIAVPLGTLTLSGKVPTVLTPVAIAVPAGSLSLTAQTPTVAVTANQNIAVPAGALSITGFAPTVVTSGSVTINVPSGTLSLTAQIPTVQATANQSIAVPAGTLTLTGLAPTVSVGSNIAIAVPAGSLSLTAQTPTVAVSNNQQISVPLGQLVLNGLAPTIGLTQNVNIDVPLGQLTLTGFAPTVLGQFATPAEVPAGRRIRNIYRVTIDGQVFEFRTLQEALTLLDQAKQLAAKVAEDQEIWQQPKAPPVITVSSRELRKAATETKREIQAIYDKAAIYAELRMLLELSRRQEEDETLLLLM